MSTSLVCFNFLTTQPREYRRFATPNCRSISPRAPDSSHSSRSCSWYTDRSTGLFPRRGPLMWISRSLQYNALVERYDRLKAQYDEVSTAISDNEARYEQMGRFITVLKDQEGVITEFDDALWCSLVEKIVVKSKEDVTVVFKDGTEMKAE